LPWLETIARAAAGALSVPPERLHLKIRSSGAKYPRLARTGKRIEVRERDLRFLVNLDDYIDTGLFADHRETRSRVRAEARGAMFLNLFAYTGSFTCAGARGASPYRGGHGPGGLPEPRRAPRLPDHEVMPHRSPADTSRRAPARSLSGSNGSETRLPVAEGFSGPLRSLQTPGVRRSI